MRLPRTGSRADSVAVFSDADVAALYDLLNPWDPDEWPSDRFYTELVMAADSVLDVGCGTGTMLACVRERGHRGRLTGLDPDRAALDRARRHTGIEWVEGTAAEAAWEACFDLATMTGALRVWHQVESVASDVVTVTEATALADGTVLRVERASLRFPDVRALAAFLVDAGFVIDAQYGDWDRGPVTATSREIITVARK